MSTQQISGHSQVISVTDQSFGKKSASVNKNSIAQKITEQDRKKYEKKMEGDDIPAFFQLDDAHWEQSLKRNILIEKIINHNPAEVPQSPTSGPLHYRMTPVEMEQTLTKKFREMAKKGDLIREKNLSNEERGHLYPPTGKGSVNLTRYWGAEYLREHLKENTQLSATKHYVIIEDGADDVEVEVWLSKYPCASQLTNAHILSRRVEGERMAYHYSGSSALVGLGYLDFGDPGNIIGDKSVGCVVDTEKSAFDDPELDRKQSYILEYAKKRFEYLHGKEIGPLCLKIKIPVSAIFSEGETLNLSQ